ncbi:MAG TPA: tetratricopeptide repeat protein, partial [Phycisphaerae bacterium]|nr:tetratricopeptide repeat protein [Phycisphaerae bacterium]
AQVHHQDGELDEAIRWYREGLRLNPDYAWGHLHLGQALLQEGRWRDAEAQLRRGIALEPDTPNVPWAYVALGEALAKQYRTDEAIAAWREALAHDPRVPRADAELCATLRRLGRDREAAEHCAAAARLQAERHGSAPGR